MPDTVRIAVTKALIELSLTPRGKDLLTRVPFVKLVKTSYAEYQGMESWGLEDFYVKSE